MDAPGPFTPLEKRPNLYPRIFRGYLLSTVYAGCLAVLCTCIGFVLAVSFIAAAVVESVFSGEEPDFSWVGGRAIGIVALLSFACYLPVLVWAVVKGDASVVKRLGGRTPEGQDEVVVRNVAEEAAIAAGIAPPEVRIVESRYPTALAVAGPRRVTVIATTGLLELLPRPALQAIVGAQVARALSGDLRFTTFVSVNSAAAHSVGSWLESSLGSEGCLAALASIPPLLLTEVAVPTMGAAAMGRRVHLSDDLAVKLIRDPDALVNGLTLLGEHSVAIEQPKAGSGPAKGAAERQGEHKTFDQPPLGPGEFTQQDLAPFGGLEHLLAVPPQAGGKGKVAGGKVAERAARRVSHPSVAERVRRIEQLLAPRREAAAPAEGPLTP